jgi:hypothetical protein
MHVKSQPEVVETQWGVRSKWQCKFRESRENGEYRDSLDGHFETDCGSVEMVFVNLHEPHRVLSEQSAGHIPFGMGDIHDGRLRRQEHGLFFVFRDARNRIAVDKAT